MTPISPDTGHGDAFEFRFVNFTDTTGEVDDVTGEATITERAAIHGNGFYGDGATRLQVQTRPDGSRVVLLVTPTLIDPTGRPVRAGQNP